MLVFQYLLACKIDARLACDFSFAFWNIVYGTLCIFYLSFFFDLDWVRCYAPALPFGIEFRFHRIKI